MVMDIKEDKDMRTMVAIREIINMETKEQTNKAAVQNVLRIVANVVCA
jgi:hypothetical protein